MNREIYNPINKYEGTLFSFRKALYENKIFYDDNKIVNDLTSCPLDGAYLSLSKIDSLVILFHSPEGCCTSLWFLWGGAFSLKSQVEKSKARGAITLTSGLGESEIIYGGVNSLMRAIKDVNDKYNPEYTVVLSSCASTIIGDDINKCIRYGKEVLSMNIDWLDTAGFKTWYWPSGYDLAHKFIVKNIMDINFVKNNEAKIVNLIGYGNAAVVDENELVRLLNLCDIEVQLPLKIPYTSIEKIRMAPRANLNIMMCKTYGIAFCLEMKKKFGINYLDTTQQIGSYYTEKFLREVGRYFNCLERVEEVILNEKKVIQRDIKELRNFFKGKKIAISAGHDKAFSILSVMKELNLKVVYLGLLTYDDLVKDKINEICEYLGYDFPISVNPQTYEEVTTIKKIRPDVYMAPAGITARINVSGIPSVNLHFNDFEGNYFGFSGVINIGKNIEDAIKKEKLFYVTANSLEDYSGRCLKYDSEQCGRRCNKCH